MSYLPIAAELVRQAVEQAGLNAIGDPERRIIAGRLEQGIDGVIAELVGTVDRQGKGEKGHWAPSLPGGGSGPNIRSIVSSPPWSSTTGRPLPWISWPQPVDAGEGTRGVNHAGGDAPGRANSSAGERSSGGAGSACTFGHTCSFGNGLVDSGCLSKAAGLGAGLHILRSWYGTVELD
jgi:hypothetical protein